MVRKSDRREFVAFINFLTFIIFSGAQMKFKIGPIYIQAMYT